MNILVVDDDGLVVEALRLLFRLQWQDAEVVSASEGYAAVDRFFSVQPDVVVLDIGLPGLNGFEVLTRIRQVSDTPVVMLSAHQQELEKVRALELGADDYLTKPFGQLELLARVRAILRRAELPPPLSIAPDLVAGDLSINFAARQVAVNGIPVVLTPVEYGLLYHLTRNAGHVLTHDALSRKLWGTADHGDATNLKVYISRLRAKLGDDAEHPRWIETVPRVGYRFVRALRPVAVESIGERVPLLARTFDDGDQAAVRE